MFEFIAFVLAIIALVKASRLKGKISNLAQQLGESSQIIDQLKLEIARLGSALPVPSSPAAPPAQPTAVPSAPETPAQAPLSESPAPHAPEVATAPTSSEPAPVTPPATPVPPAIAVAPWQPAAAARVSDASDGSVPPIPPPTVADGAVPTPPPAAAISMEEWLGTRWAVWLGGLALGLGGLLLVRYSIEQGYFGPGARIVLGLLFATALLAVGEWFRRGERDVGLDIVPAAHIPSVLTAAGTATMFGTIYAAHALYGFIGSGTTFVLLGFVAICTMFAAALHGPALAGFGLVGAYAAPLLVSSVRPSPWPVVVYLAVVAASAMGLARLRHWVWLAASAIIGALGWGLVFIDQMGSGSSEWMLAGLTHAFVQLLLAAVFLAFEPHPAAPDEDARIDPVSSWALGALTVLAILMLGRVRHDLASFVPFALAIAGLLLVTAWRNASAAIAACFAGLVVLTCIALWPSLSGPPLFSLMTPELAFFFRTPENVQTYLMIAILMSAGVCLGTAQRLWTGGRLPPTIAAVYALAATVTPLMALILTWARIKQFDASLAFAFTGLALAVAFGLATDRFQQRDGAHSDGARIASGAFAVAAIASLSFALIATLDRGYLTVALALTAWGAAWVADRRGLPLLRHVVTALALIVLARIVWDPRIMGANVGRLPVLNWLLVGYGVSSAAFYTAARLMERCGADLPQRLSDAVALLLAGLLAFFQIRHALNDGDIFALTSGHIELGLMALVSLGFSNALMRLDLGRRNVIFHWASIAFAALSAVLILIGLGLVENPLFSGDRVIGPVIFSSLILGYLMPGLAALYVARASRGSRPEWLVNGLTILAALLLFGWATLEVRHAFHGPHLNLNLIISHAEHMAYWAAWLLLGIAFLTYGVRRDDLVARVGSLALVGLASLKLLLIVGGHIEIGLTVLVSFGLSHVLMTIDRDRVDQQFYGESLVFAAIASALIVLGLGLRENPLFTDDPVLGPVIFSSLILGYLMPGLAALYVARASRGSRPDWLVNGLTILAALLLFGWATLEVRHAFQGPSIMLWRDTGSAELWAYSATWLSLGVISLAYGMWRANLMARIASALLVALSIAKVFLVDLAGLTGLWRALSFIMLGVVLIGIGLAYQTFVFAKPRQSPSGPTDEPPITPNAV